MRTCRVILHDTCRQAAIASRPSVSDSKDNKNRTGQKLHDAVYPRRKSHPTDGDDRPRLAKIVGEYLFNAAVSSILLRYYLWSIYIPISRVVVNSTDKKLRNKKANK
ncbi:uncharacterized protein BDW43DRAFT_259730 [Aspergillus alliaceus]|uniref:uncharacterized protein n=1 Tax=Petromyces alliaceus TaxID=209559 RepID=UPI0012A5A5A2|nr:uncharacterized protein BDW43DRAFT_259730 [Aspergillus alliaceus]KAB8238753.1 hypothetical protein BDW43DRAFT_259730 [Aspergillus alliaceus]